MSGRVVVDESVRVAACDVCGAPILRHPPATFGWRHKKRTKDGHFARPRAIAPSPTLTVPTMCESCGQSLPQRDRVLRAIQAGARDVDDVVRLAGVPRRHVAPLVAKLRDLGLARGAAGAYESRRPRRHPNGRLAAARGRAGGTSA